MAWSDLDMHSKHKFIRLGVSHGMDLNEIEQMYNSMDSGGNLSDPEYYAIMEQVARENWRKWGDESEDAALYRILNDNVYDYRGYYNKYPDSRVNADTHWTDEFKSVYHPTFSDESIYSPNNPRYIGTTDWNPNDIPGGHWYGDMHIPTFSQMADRQRRGYAFGGNMELESNEINGDPLKKIRRKYRTNIHVNTPASRIAVNEAVSDVREHLKSEGFNNLTDDEAKGVFHPTASIYSKHSGKVDPVFNPTGAVFGRWVDDNHEYRMSDDMLNAGSSPYNTFNYISNAEDNGLRLRDERGLRFPDFRESKDTYLEGVLPAIVVTPDSIFANSGNLYPEGGDVDIVEKYKGTKHDLTKDASHFTSGDFDIYANDLNFSEDNDVIKYFKSYVNSPGYNRIQNDQQLWWESRHPYRKYVPDFLLQSDRAKSGSDYLKNHVNKYPDKKVFAMDSYADLSEYSPRTNNAYVGRWSHVNSADGYYFDYNQAAAHELAHGFNIGTNYGAQKEALERNTNTLKNGHDEHFDEKHGDVWGLKYALFKEGIYDSRSSKKATKEHIKKLRKKYPNLRILKQLDDEKAAWIINYVAQNDKEGDNEYLNDLLSDGGNLFSVGGVKNNRGLTLSQANAIYDELDSDPDYYPIIASRPASQPFDYDKTTIDMPMMDEIVVKPTLEEQFRYANNLNNKEIPDATRVGDDYEFNNKTYEGSNGAADLFGLAPLTIPLAATAPVWGPTVGTGLGFLADGELATALPYVTELGKDLAIGEAVGYGVDKVTNLFGYDSWGDMIGSQFNLTNSDKDILEWTNPGYFFGPEARRIKYPGISIKFQPNINSGINNGTSFSRWLNDKAWDIQAKIDKFKKGRRIKYTLDDLVEAQSNYDDRIFDLSKVYERLNGREAFFIPEEKVSMYKEWAESDPYWKAYVDKYNVYKEIESEFPEYAKRLESFDSFRNMERDALFDITTETINIGGKEYRYIKPEYDQYIDGVYDSSFYLHDPIGGTIGIDIPNSEKVYNLNELIGLKSPKVVQPKNIDPINYEGFEDYQKEIIKRINDDVSVNGPLSKFMKRNNLTIDDILPHMAHPEAATSLMEIKDMATKYVEKNLIKERDNFIKLNSDKYFGMGHTIPDEDTFVKSVVQAYPDISTVDASNMYYGKLNQMESDFMKEYPEIYDYIENNYGNAFQYKGFTYTPLTGKGFNGKWSETVAHELSHLLDGNYYGIPGGRNGKTNNRTESLLFDLAFTPESTGHKNYFLNNDGTEYVARGTQLKNYVDADEISGEMLNQAKHDYVKDTGLNNNMKDMFRSIFDVDAAAKWMSSHAKGMTIPITVGAVSVENNKSLGGELLSPFSYSM